jgi:exodeoxyribonuclease V alpha subunit
MEGDLPAIERALAGLRRQQLLCALREGEFGAGQVNEVIEAQLRAGLDGYAEQVWYPGRAVMITRNDYASDLFNGDVGLCLRHCDIDGAERLQVWFEASPTADVRVRGFAPGSLPALQGAFALTVHKSQGSEYGRVAVLLPPDASSPMLSRQMLYTALSRARQSVEIWGSQAATHAALLSPMWRSGQLRQRLDPKSPSGL